MLEIIPKPMPVASWINNNAQKLLRNKPKVLISGAIAPTLESKPHEATKVINRVIKAAKTPTIIPWIKNGPRMNQFEAPTNLIVEISSLEL